jgi:glycosyltransferase involved in cell wall biosynthesis
VAPRLSPPLRVLWIATKAPLPAIDGGRLVAAATLEALASRGVEVTLVAPTAGQPLARGPDGVRTLLVDARPRPWLHAAAASLRSGDPISIARHAHAAVAARISDLIRREAFDIVHIEQPQAWRSAAAARESGAAVVFRAQNVESAMWEAAAAANCPGPAAAVALRPLWAAAMRIEARRMRRFEASVINAADVTIALSSTDAARLAALSASARIVVVPPPAAAEAPPVRAERLAGDPAFVWIGSAGWSPNAEAVRWLLDEIWPAVASRLPRAQLHGFGASRVAGATAHGSAITWHPAPADSRAVFAADAILLLPLTIAAGVRMRLLDAWSGGMPVIASPSAVEGLDTDDGRDVVIARDAAAFGEAAMRLAADADLRAQLAAGGRATIARRHTPAVIADAMLAAYHEAMERRAAGSVVANSVPSVAAESRRTIYVE